MRNQGGTSGFRGDDRAAALGAHGAVDTVQRLPAANPEQVFFHFDFVRSLQMHRRMALWIFFTAVVLSLGYMAKRWNTYKGESLVYVQPSPRRVIETGPGQQWPYDSNTYESYIQQQVHDVTRPDVLARAVRQLPGWQGASESEQAAADRLGSAIEVTRVGTAYEVSIVATASSAEEAARMANAVAGSFIDSATRQERAGDPQRIELLRDERERIMKELAADRTEQDQLSQKLGVAAMSGGNTPDPIDQQIAETRSELVKAKTDNDQAAAKLTALAGGKTSNAALEAEAEALVSADPGLVSMKTSLNARRSVLISQMANLTPSHPQYKQDAEELAKINTSLDEMTRDLRTKASAQIEQRLKNDLERTSSVEARLNGQLAALTGAAGSAAPRLQRTNELSTDIQRLQNRFAVVDEQFRNLTMENNAPGAVYLASAALPPLHAARAKVFRNSFILLLAGLVFALAAALVAHNLDPKIYIAADVERVLGIPPMAQVPDLLEVGSGVAEEYLLRLAAAVEHAHQQGLLSNCIFTGVGTGAGATTVATRVSNMLEAMGRQTVLVDAVGAPPARSGEGALSSGTDMVRAPRGKRSSALLHQMAEDTAEDTVVITDTAPLLVSGETEYLARFVDSAIVVIESGVTTKAQLREVSKTLHRLDVSSVGFVLNRVALEYADAAFRQSLRAVDTHLRSQARSFERTIPTPEMPAERHLAPEALKEQLGAEASPEPFSAPPVPLSMDRLWSVVSESDAGAAPEEVIPQMQAQQDAAASSQKPEDRSEATIEPAAVRPGERVAGAQPAMQPERRSEPESADEVANRLQQNVRPVGEQTEARGSATGFVPRPLRGRETVRTAPVGELRAAPERPVAEGPANRSVPVTQPKVAEAPVFLAPAIKAEERSPEIVLPHVPAWEDLPANRFDAARAASQQPPAAAQEVARPVVAQGFSATAASPSTALTLVPPAAEGAEDELPYSAASRLGGLRSLLTSLGMKNLHKEAEQRKANLDATPAIEKQGERSVFAQTEGAIESIKGHVPALPAEVRAAPEIIPPRLVSEIPEREKDRDTPRPVKPPRVSRWDTTDDVETLPSKRGQYRKRH